MRTNNKLLYKAVFVLSICLAAVFFNTDAYAGTTAQIYINGYNVEKFPTASLESGQSYVPADTLEVLLGYTSNYDKDSNIITLVQPELNTSIQMTVGSNTAEVNDKETVLPAAPFISNGKPMVSLRFVSEALGGKIVWKPAINIEGYGFISEPARILIYAPYAVKLESENARIASKIYTHSYSLTDSDNKEKNISYDLVIPVLSEMKDTHFQNQLNDKFASLYESIKKEAENVYNEQKNEKPEYRYNYTNDLQYIVANDSGSLLSLLFDEYVYMGGAHGMPYRFAFNIDFNESKLLSLSDLFIEGKDYTKKLVDEMNTIRQESSDAEYDDVEEVKNLPATPIPNVSDNNSFYITDDTLYIFYHPYELSFYARGFVDFRIPLANLQDYLQLIQQ